MDRPYERVGDAMNRAAGPGNAIDFMVDQLNVVAVSAARHAVRLASARQSGAVLAIDDGRAAAIGMAISSALGTMNYIDAQIKRLESQ